MSDTTVESPTLFPSRAAKVRYGGICDMTPWRWERSPDVQFPKPICPATIMIAGPATIMVAGESARRGLSAGGAQPRPETGPCGHGLPVAPVFGGFGPA